MWKKWVTLTKLSSTDVNFDKMLASMQFYLFKWNVWWFSRLKGNWGYLWLPDVVHKRRKINSDLFCLKKTGQVHGYSTCNILQKGNYIVGEKILNDKLKTIMILP